MIGNQALKSYIRLRFFSALFFAVIVTVNLVYQATVVGLNPLQLVLVGTLLEFVSFVFEIPTGIVADLYSRKLSVMIGVILVGLGFMLEGSVPTFFAVLLAQVIWGVGYTFISGAREAWIADEVGENEAGRAFIKGAQAGQAGLFMGIAASMFLANIDIRIPIVAGGFFYSMQALFIAFMPENNFKPVLAGKRETFRSMKNMFIAGSELVKKNNVFSVIIAASVIFGMFSEGFDRLWTPFMIDSFAFPSIGGIKPVVWFGAISMVAAILAAIMTEFFKKRTDFSNHRSTVGALLLVNAFLILGVVGFGFSTGFIMAAAMYWLAAVFREIREPIHDAWINQNVTSNVRATVFSMCSQANAIGQVVGGPFLGVIASFVALRAGIIVAGLILIPTLFLYACAIKNHKLISQ